MKKGKDFFGIIFPVIFSVRKLKKILRFSTLFLLVFLSTYSTAYSASSYYVDNSVGTSGNGSIGSPWKNFSNINWTTIANASKPCTIYVSGGASSQTYNETLTVGASGSSSTYPYTGTPTGEIIIKRPSSVEWSGHSGIVYIRSSSGYVIDITSRSNIILDGLDVRATGSSDGDAAIFSGYGTPATYIVIRNCTTINNAGYGIALQDAQYITIQYNTLGPNYNWYGNDCIGAWGSDTVVEYNIITATIGPAGEGGAHSDGVHFGGPSDGWTFRYNIFRIQEVAYLIYFETLAGGPLTNMKVYGNIFEVSENTTGASNRAVEFDCNLGGANNYTTAWIYNNTFVNINNDSIGGFHAGISQISNCSSSSMRIYAKNNIFYNSLTYLAGCVTSTCLTLNNNLYYTDSVQDSSIITWSSSETNYTSLATFKAAHPGFETNGRQGNPNLASVTSSSSPNHDVRPTVNSTLLIGTGDATLGATYQNGLNMSTLKSSWPLSVTLTGRGVAWDIGAYEYGNVSPNQPQNLRIAP